MAAATPSVHKKPEAFALVASVEDATVEGDIIYQPASAQSGLTRDLVAAVPILGVTVNRKKRLARQRRSSSTVKLLSFSNSSTSSLQLPSSTLTARVIDPKRLRFLLQKEIKNSDVSSLRRMILPKRKAEAHLPVLESKEGIIINMDDLDGLHVWS